MRTARFRDPAGSVRTGVWTDDGIEFGERFYDPDAANVLAQSSRARSSASG